MILGLARHVIAAATEQLGRGILFAGQSQAEFEAARLACELVPCAEMVRFGSSGSEMVHAALRLARAATGPQHGDQIRGPLPAGSTTSTGASRRRSTRLARRARHAGGRQHRPGR